VPILPADKGRAAGIAEVGATKAGCSDSVVCGSPYCIHRERHARVGRHILIWLQPSERSTADQHPGHRITWARARYRSNCVSSVRAATSRLRAAHSRYSFAGGIRASGDEHQALFSKVAKPSPSVEHTSKVANVRGREDVATTRDRAENADVQYFELSDNVMPQTILAKLVPARICVGGVERPSTKSADTALMVRSSKSCYTDTVRRHRYAHNTPDRNLAVLISSFMRKTRILRSLLSAPQQIEHSIVDAMVGAAVAILEESVVVVQCDGD
jgi:hypothetical protein